MKTVIIVAFACCFVLALAEVNEKCSSNDQCGADECCRKFAAFLSGKCEKLGQSGEKCHPEDKLNKADKYYRFYCPCAQGLECIAKEYGREEMHVIYERARCVSKS